MNILITSAGRRVSLIRAFRDEVLKIEPDSRVLAVDKNPCLSPACKVSDDYFKVPQATSPDYISTLVDICVTHQVDLLIPTIDPELSALAKNRKLFEDNGTKAVISQPEFIENCLNKRNTAVLFEKKQISTPRILDKDALNFPVYAKPISGSSSKNNHIIKDYAELRKYHLKDESILFFEYLDQNRHDEYTLDLYYDRNSRLKCVVPRRRIEVRSGEVSKGLTEKNLLVPFVEEKLGYLSGARGCLNLQLFVHKKNHNIYGIEINPRFGGGYPLSYFASANYPKWLIQEYLFDDSIEYFDEWETNLLMLRYDHEVLVYNYKD